MGENSNRRLAERLNELATQLAKNGDATADATVSAAVAALEQALIPSERELDRPTNMDVANEILNFGTSKELSVVVEEIRSTTSLGQPPSERFREEIAQHDRTRCIASIAFEDLWNGFDGWKSPSVFWGMVVFVWRNASDFFEDYDPKREIVEEPSRWTQRYFDEQRNFLRHNFCLRRLCHLVMVYEYLHGAEAAVKKAYSVQPPSSIPRHNKEAPEATKPNRFFLSRIALIVCVVFSVAGMICLLAARNDVGRPKSVAVQPEAVKIASEQPSPNQAAQAISEDETNLLAGTSARDEIQKQDARSNEVVKSTIALQETATKVEKAPIRKAGSVTNKQ